MDMSRMSAIGRLNEQAAVRVLNVDDVRFTYVVDGSMALIPDAFFPAIPRRYWEEHPELLDGDGRIAMSAGGILVERGEHKLLIDAGFGVVDAETPMGRIRCGAFLNSLASVGVSPGDITGFVLTHIHGDHTGWALTRVPSGTIFPTFPNARYAVSEAEWEPHSHGEHSRGTPDVSTVVEPLGRICTRFADGATIAPQVTAVITPGHSAGHTSYVIGTMGGTRVVAFGDVFHHPVQLSHDEWGSAPDADPARVGRARTRILEELERPHTIGFAVHFGDQPFGRVIRDAAEQPQWLPVPSEIVTGPPQI